MEEDPEVLLVRQIRRRRIQLAIGLTLVACVAMYPCCNLTWSCASDMAEHAAREAEHDHEATPEQRAELERTLAAVEASLPARESAFETATRDLAIALVPRPDLGPCPVHVPLRAGGSVQEGWSVDMNYDDFETLAFPGRHSFPWATLPTSEAPRVSYARERITALREAISRHDTLEAIAGVVSASHELESAFWTWDVVVVPETWQMPFADPGTATFDGGLAEGTAYLHDYASGAVICAGRFSATTTSQVIETQGTDWGGAGASASLRTEMESEIERAISRSLVHRAGPPLPPPTSESDGAPM